MTTKHEQSVSTHVSQPLVERALVYVDYGWALVPLNPRSKQPHLELLGELYGDTRTEHLKRAPALTVEVEWWFLNWDDINIGVIPTVRSGLVICDVDDLDLLDPDLATPTASSGREEGGKHLYFRSSQPVAMSPQAWGHVNPAYAVAPGSTHPTGRMYEWLPGLSPEDVPLMAFEDARPMLGLGS